MMPMKRLFASAFLCIVLFAGCSVLSPTPDKSKFLVLTPIPGADGGGGPPPPGATIPSSALAIGLGPIQLPEYLDRPEVVMRTSQNTLELSPIDRWAEPLGDNFRRVLENDLMFLLGTNQIVQYPWFANASLDYAIRVYVSRFEANVNDGAQLIARWDVVDAKSGKLLISRETDLNQALSSYDSQAIAAGLSADLGELGKQIAEAIQQLQPQRAARRVS
jgi:uncharacterized lipoprotein YmbA